MLIDNKNFKSGEPYSCIRSKMGGRGAKGRERERYEKKYVMRNLIKKQDRYFWYQGKFYCPPYSITEQRLIATYNSTDRDAYSMNIQLYTAQQN